MPDIGTPSFKPISQDSAVSGVDQSLLAEAYALCHEGVSAALHAGIQQPLSGIAQLSDRVTGSNLLAHVQFMEAPKPTEFGTAKWHAQTIGSAVGMILPFMLAGKCKSAIVGESKPLAQNVFSRKTMIGHSIKESAVLGFGTDFVTRPVEDTKARNFWQQRLVNGVSGAATFGALTGGAAALKWTSGLNATKRLGISPILENPVMAGVISGIPGGTSSAVIDWARTGEFSLKHLGQSIYGMSVAGGALGLKSHIFIPKTHNQQSKGESSTDVTSVKLEFADNVLKQSRLQRVELPNGEVYERKAGEWQRNGQSSDIQSVEIDGNGNISIKAEGWQKLYRVLNDGGRVTEVQDFYDIYQGGNLDFYFANQKNFARLEGSRAFELLKTRHERVVLNYGVEAIEKYLPEVTKEKGVCEELSLLLTTKEGRAQVLDPEQFQNFVPHRSWLDSSGRRLSKEEAMEKIRLSAAELEAKNSDLEFNYTTARKIAEYVVPQSIINSGRADVFDDHIQFSRRRDRDLSKVSKAPEQYLGFHLPEENVSLIREIKERQKAGLVPAEFEKHSGAEGSLSYSVKSWRAATPEEMVLPLSELTKTLKLIDYGFTDGNGNPSLGKISLGIHDSFDHLALFQELQERGLFGKTAQGRGYRGLMKEFGMPQATDMFNRESELIASIGFEWRAFTIMPKEYDPPVSLFQIRGYLSEPKTANQRAALEYVADLIGSDPHGKSDQAKLLRHQFYSIERELKEQERQTGLTFVRPDFKDVKNRLLTQVATSHPEFAAFIVDVTLILGNAKDVNSPFRQLVIERNLLYEDYLQRVANGETNLKKAVPTDEMIEAIRRDGGVTPDETKRWMEQNLGFNSRRAAQRNPYELQSDK